MKFVNVVFVFYSFLNYEINIILFIYITYIFILDMIVNSVIVILFRMLAVVIISSLAIVVLSVV